MVPFAGYSMPVTYMNQGLGDSHKHVREKVGLFDVSHMVQHRYDTHFPIPSKKRYRKNQLIQRKDSWDLRRSGSFTS